MSLSRLRKEIQAIREVLRGNGEMRGAHLAEQYAAACRRAQHRLEQCIGMLEAGNELQAFQLAETPPSLLDELTLLSFREMEAWRVLCRSRGWQLPDPFDVGQVRALNGAYGRGLSAQHPLYREYRKAILQRRELEALQTLRAIVRLNPEDTNAAGELERIELRVGQSKQEELRGLVRRGAQEEAVRCLEEMQELQLPLDREDEGWRQAQVWRWKKLLERTEEEQARGGSWASALEWVEGWEQVQLDIPGLLPAADTGRWRALQKWVRQEQAAAEEEAKFERAKKELWGCLDTLRRKEAGRTRRSGSELLEDLEWLEHRWRVVEGFGRAVGESSLVEVEKLRHLLKGHLQRRMRVKQLAFGAATGVMVILAVLVIGTGLARHRAGEAADELRAARLGGLALPVENQLSEVEARYEDPSGYEKLNEERSAARQWLAENSGRQQELGQAVEELEAATSDGFREQTAARVHDRLVRARQLAEELAPDLGLSERQRLASVQADWERWVAGAREEWLAELAESLAKAAERAEEVLSYEADPSFRREALVDFEQHLNAVAERMEWGRAVFDPPPDLAARHEALAARWERFQREWLAWEESEEALQRSPNLEAYQEALEQRQDSPFITPEQAAAMRAVLSMGIQPETVAGHLLLPESPELWALTGASNGFQLMPEVVMPAERRLLKEWRDDENIHGVTVYRVTPRTGAGGHVVFVRGSLERNRFGRMEGMVYDPVQFPDELEWRQREYHSSDHYVEYLRESKQAEAYQRFGLRDLMKEDASGYQLGLLHALDHIQYDQESSPLFRAWMAMRIYEMMDLQPVGWGYAWSRAARQNRQGLEEKSAGELASGDWMVPKEISKFSNPLDAWFQENRDVSFAIEAGLRHRLAKAAARAGFAFAGHVQGGEVKLSEAFVAGMEAASEETVTLWGWNEEKAPAALVQYQTGTGQGTIQGEALDWSPLLFFKGNAARILDEAMAGFGIESAGDYEGYLPKLFQLEIREEAQ